MTWPKHRSAWSLGTPALLIKLRAVRRQSCNVQPFVPDALSSWRLKLEKLLIGVAPLVVKTKGPAFGKLSRIAWACRLRGRTKSTLVLFLAAGNVQSLPSISSQVILLASLRLAAVSNRKRTYRLKMPSSVAQTLRISSSVRTRSLAVSLGLVRAIPRTTGDRKSSLLLACQFITFRTRARVWVAMEGPLPSST